MVEINNYSFITTVCYLDSNERVINAIPTAESSPFVYGSRLHPNGRNTVPHSHKR